MRSASKAAPAGRRGGLRVLREGRVAGRSLLILRALGLGVVILGLPGVVSGLAQLSTEPGRPEAVRPGDPDRASPPGAPEPACVTLGEVQEAIVEIINRMAPLYNIGYHRETFEIYDALAKLLIEEISHCKHPSAIMTRARTRLLGGRTEADRVPGMAARAWALRYAFDEILALDEPL